MRVCVEVCAHFIPASYFYYHQQIQMKFCFLLSGERAMSPAQSEDSGLAADRGTTYATISLPRENAQAMGIVFLGKSPLRMWLLSMF